VHPIEVAGFGESWPPYTFVTKARCKVMNFGKCPKKEQKMRNKDPKETYFLQLPLYIIHNIPASQGTI
jgi:hypothetical protein